MPQLTLEFSSNIIEKIGIECLFASCHTLLANTLPAELASCKSRIIEATTFYIGDGNPNNAFVHMSLKVKAGRSKETLKKVGESLMEILKAHFKDSAQKLNLQITIEIMELQDTYFKIQSGLYPPVSSQ